MNQWRWTQLHCSACWVGRPVWARGRCRISPPRFLAECCKRQLNQVRFVLLYFRLSAFSDFIQFVCLYFPVLFCLSVSVKWLAVKTASEMTYTVSSGALNSTQTKPKLGGPWTTEVLVYKCQYGLVYQGAQIMKSNWYLYRRTALTLSSRKWQTSSWTAFPNNNECFHLYKSCVGRSQNFSRVCTNAVDWWTIGLYCWCDIL